jgi:WD40 repeat protein
MFVVSGMFSGYLGFASPGIRVVADEPKWKEQPALETPGWLPVSAAYSEDGKRLVLGGAAGEVAAFDPANRQQKWKTNTGGGVAAVAFSSDGDSVLATFHHGLRLLSSRTGKLDYSIEEKESHPTAVAAFPDREIVVPNTPKVVSHKIIYGNARSYFVKLWIVPVSTGEIELAVVAEGKQPADEHAVPLAVDPKGRSVILTGPVHRDTGKNVLWAWVAGDYEEGSPGNRLLEGHDAMVVSAAWSKDGKTAVSGDSEGRVIVWDAETMKEEHRRELGDRIAAVAISPDGKQVVAIAVGDDARYFVWDPANFNADAPPLAVDSHDYAGAIRGCLAFSPDGRQLVGSAVNLAWLTRLGELTGKLHVWEAAAE